MAKIRGDMRDHHQTIHELRAFYMNAISRAANDDTFQTVIYDGSDTNSCKCPHRWRQHMRNEAESNTFIEQKIQTVLIHQRKLLFFMAPEFVPRGGNLTASCVLASLPYIGPEVRVVRFQHDGKRSSLQCLLTISNCIMMCQEEVRM